MLQNHYRIKLLLLLLTKVMIGYLYELYCLSYRKNIEIRNPVFFRGSDPDQFFLEGRIRINFKQIRNPVRKGPYYQYVAPISW